MISANKGESPQDGGYCDCEILMNLIDDDEDDELPFKILKAGEFIISPH
jgi:hypothetical protein